MQRFNPDIVAHLAQTASGWYGDCIDYMLSDRATFSLISRFKITGDPYSPTLVNPDITLYIMEYLRGIDLVNFASTNKGIRYLCCHRASIKNNKKALNTVPGWYLGEFHRMLFAKDECASALHWHDWTAYDRISAMSKMLYEIRDDKKFLVRNRITILTNEGLITLCGWCGRFVSIWVSNVCEIEFDWVSCKACKSVSIGAANIDQDRIIYVDRGGNTPIFQVGNPYIAEDIATFESIITNNVVKKYFAMFVSDIVRIGNRQF